MDRKYFRTVHLVAIGASIGLVLFSFVVKMGMSTAIPADKWVVPLVIGLIFLGMEYLIQRKPR